PLAPPHSHPAPEAARGPRLGEGNRPALAPRPPQIRRRADCMDLELRDRVAVVTGGTSGIGLAAAGVFLDEGACVAICGRDATRLDAAKESLLGNGASDRLLAQQCDVLDKAAVSRFAAAVEQQWQGRCDILVNNAGQARMSAFADTS